MRERERERERETHKDREVGRLKERVRERMFLEILGRTAICRGTPLKPPPFCFYLFTLFAAEFLRLGCYGVCCFGARQQTVSLIHRCAAVLFSVFSYLGWLATLLSLALL